MIGGGRHRAKTNAEIHRTRTVLWWAGHTYRARTAQPCMFMNICAPAQQPRLITHAAHHTVHVHTPLLVPLACSVLVGSVHANHMLITKNVRFDQLIIQHLQCRRYIRTDKQLFMPHSFAGTTHIRRNRQFGVHTARRSVYRVNLRSPFGRISGTKPPKSRAMYHLGIVRSPRMFNG